MREYWKRPDATADAFRDGWYHTGDAGYLDEQGYLFLVDRVKDMIVTGGENVYSVEVENAIASYPDVAQVAVIGIPDDKWGEAVHAIVVPAGGHAPDAEAEIIAHARESIAGYKVPKSVEIRTEPLPLSGALKVLKRELRAPYWAGHDRARQLSARQRVTRSSTTRRSVGAVHVLLVVVGAARSCRGRGAGGARRPAAGPSARGPSTSHVHVSPTNSASVGSDADRGRAPRRTCAGAACGRRPRPTRPSRRPCR